MAVPEGGAVFTRRTFLDASLAAVVGAMMGSQAGAKEAAITGGGTNLAPSREALAFLSIERASALIRTKKVSPVELTQACLSRIERLNPQLNAFIMVTAESALAEARRAEAEIQKQRWRGALHGIPIALKDLVDTAGVRTTAGSELFKDRIPAEDAEVVRRLKAAGPCFSASSTCTSSPMAAAQQSAFSVPFAIPGISLIVRAGPLEDPQPLSRRTFVTARSAPTPAVLFANRRHTAVSSDSNQPTGA